VTFGSTSCHACILSAPRLSVNDWPETVTFALATVVTEPIAEVIAIPVTSATTTASTVPIAEVSACPVNVKLASPVMLIEPKLEVSEIPVTSTGVFKSTVSSPIFEVKLNPVSVTLASAVIATELIVVLNKPAVVTTGPTSIDSETCPIPVFNAFSVALIVMLPSASKSTAPIVEVNVIPFSVAIESASKSI